MLQSLLVLKTSAGVFKNWCNWKDWTTLAYFVKESSTKLMYLLVTPVIKVAREHIALKR